MKKNSIRKNGFNKSIFRLMTAVQVIVTAMAVSGSAFAGRGAGIVGNGTNNMADGLTPSERPNGTLPEGTGSGRGMGDSEDRGMGNVILTEGTPFTYTGEVAAVDAVFAIDIKTSDGETVTIHGIGPNEYWETLDIARPVLGDFITVTGYSVEFNNVVRNIAFTVEINGQSVEIRDAEGNPAWKQAVMDILSGTPFEYSGTVAVQSGFKTPMIITTDAGEEIAVRIGTPMYWESIGTAQPVAGDYVTVTGYALTVNDITVYFAAAVTIGDNTVDLLDADGKPLWKQDGRGNGGNGGRGGFVPAAE